jgi:DNA/RNA-binding domain of Phe-tRNA-synthetase-like protein
MDQPLPVSFSALIAEKIPGMHLGILLTKKCTILIESDLVRSELNNLEQYIRQKFARERPAADPVVSAVRRMYRRIGWEPTQYRPSSEAMIRRILNRKGLYRINNLVDLANIVSTRYHLPMGLYDLDKIDTAVVVDVGRPGETYQGIFKELIHAEGKLILRDGSGIFGNPTADSARTCIDTASGNLLAVFFTPPEIELLYLENSLNTLAGLYRSECPDCTSITLIVQTGGA